MRETVAIINDDIKKTWVSPQGNKNHVGKRKIKSSRIKNKNKVQSVLLVVSVHFFESDFTDLGKFRFQRILVFLFFVCLVLIFPDRVVLYSPGCPVTL